MWVWVFCEWMFRFCCCCSSVCCLQYFVFKYLMSCASPMRPMTFSRCVCASGRLRVTLSHSHSHAHRVRIILCFSHSLAETEWCTVQLIVIYAHAIHEVNWNGTRIASNTWFCCCCCFVICTILIVHIIFVLFSFVC